MGDVPSMAGTTVLGTRRVFEEMVGGDRVLRALGRLEAEERDTYASVGTLSWVPITIVDAVLFAVAAESGISHEKLLEESTRKTQERLLHTVYRVLMRLTTDEALISRTPTFYGKTYNTGKLTSTFPAPGEAVVTLTEWPMMPETQIRGLGYGIETTLRCAGRKDARAVSKRAPEGAVYHCSWKK
jgi:hypothetical protein